MVNWATRDASDKAQAKILAEAFINQWNHHGYRFYKVAEHVITIGGLTVKVIPDIGVQFTQGEVAVVKLWLRKLPIAERRRQATIALLDAVRQREFLPDLRMVGVWELEQYRLNCLDTVPDEFTSSLYASAEQFVEVWNKI